MVVHTAVAPLQSKDHKTLMDIIDKLRSKGINRYVHLPQIVVCGDQSSGKSSVLQAISGMSFPAQDSLCTRFATELILRRTNEYTTEKCRVSISHSGQHSAEERARLEQFQYSDIPEKGNIGSIIDEAKVVMGVGGDQGKTFSKDVLRIELSGPTQPHLTIVDLPGLFRAGNKEQSAEDAAIVQSLVRSYMKNPRSIILAVVSAQSNFAVQEITQLARNIDARGTRTLGLITKPDTLDVSSNSERDYFNLAQNRDVNFRLGWHVVRNRDFKTRNATDEERDQTETAFFEQGVWAGLPQSQKGISSLRTRLSEVLKDQILDQLPEVLEEIQRGLEDCSNKLNKLGAARSTLVEQRKYLLNASQQFSMLIAEAIGGVYRDKFFGNAREEEGYEKRLRAVLQNILIKFSDEIHVRGQARKVVNSVPSESPRQVSRSAYLKEVDDLMKRTRGCELPGTYNPLVIGELFREQCTPWRGLLDDFSEKIYEAVEYTIDAALTYTVDEDTRDKLFEELINEAMNQLNGHLKSKVNEILRPHEDGHPITYNHYLTEDFQKIRMNRFRENITRGLRESGIGDNTVSHYVNADGCLKSILKHTEADMECLSCSDAVDWMEAYYKVALGQVIDDFSCLAIEDCLISKLPKLFTPEMVFELSDDAVKSIAGESQATADERRFLTDKMEILGSGLAELQRLSKNHQRVNVEDIEKQEIDTPSSPTSEELEDGLTPPETEPAESFASEIPQKKGKKSKKKKSEWEWN
ncbi:hypothetical protein AAE478_010089 [Parahypoxylon ruwenzoriense]